MVDDEAITLKHDADFTLDRALVAAAAGVPESRIEAVSWLHPMSFEDGGIAFAAYVFFVDRHPSSGRSTTTIHVDVRDEGIGACDLCGHVVPRDDDDYYDTWTPVPMGEDVLYVDGTDRAFLLVRGGPEIRAVRIERSVADEENVNGFKFRLYPRDAHPVSDGRSAAIPLNDGSNDRYLAFLTFDRKALTARWSAFPSEEGETPGPGGALPAVLAHELLQLYYADFPHRHVAKEDDGPYIHEALLRQGRVYIYTMGRRGRSHYRYGFDCSALSEIGANGRVTSHLFMMDFVNAGDEKSRGIDGCFTSSGRYCILTPVYASTDPWKKRKVFDMDQGKLVGVTLPRGYTKYDLMNHGGDFFWAKFEEKKDDVLRLARFRAG